MNDDTLPAQNLLGKMGWRISKWLIDDTFGVSGILIPVFLMATGGLSIGHISPEAASGGNIGKVRNGDMIEIDIPSRSIRVLVSDEELASRDPLPLTRNRVVSKALQHYAKSVSSADLGGEENG